MTYFYVLLLSLFISLPSFALPTELNIGVEPSQSKTLCVDHDPRTQTTDLKIARFRRSSFARVSCTGFMISSKCMLTAGHCVGSTRLIEFDVPKNRRGRVQSSDAVDVYELDQLIGHENAGYGKDWAVLRIKPHSLTGVFPGDRYGYFDLSQVRYQANDPLEIKGYGSSSDRDKDSTLKFSDGILQNIDEANSIIYHRVNSTGGDSGSPIIDQNTGRVMGIHTHGGCRFDSSQGTMGTNHGTLISTQSNLAQAISQCLSQ